jgi:cytoskeletal protein RodZ
MRTTIETLEKKLTVYQDALAELEKEHGKYVPPKYNNKVKGENMDKFSPAFWFIYVFMAVFLGFLAWEIIKMIIAVMTGKYIKEDRKKKGIKKK